MTKWEYLRVIVAFESILGLPTGTGNLGGKVSEIYKNGEKVPQDYKTIHDYLNHLGQDGWELIYVGGDLLITYYLKRLLE